MGAPHPFLDHPGPIAFAHRGGAGPWPENTWPAFAHAVELGYRYLETDVRATADGELVLMHDPDLGRVTDRSGRVDSLPWREVARARVGGVEPVVRLADLLEEHPDHRINLDPKQDDVVAPLATLLERTGALDRVCVASFRTRRARALRERFGRRLCAAAGPAGVARLRLAASGWPVGASPAWDCIQIPPRVGAVTLLDRDLIAAAAQHGVPVHVWTVNEQMEMHRLLDMGVAGLMTDEPARLREVLVQRGRWPGG